MSHRFFLSRSLCHFSVLFPLPCTCPSILYPKVCPLICPLTCLWSGLDLSSNLSNDLCPRYVHSTLYGLAYNLSADQSSDLEPVCVMNVVSWPGLWSGIWPVFGLALSPLLWSFHWPVFDSRGPLNCLKSATTSLIFISLICLTIWPLTCIIIRPLAVHRYVLWPLLWSVLRHFLWPALYISASDLLYNISSDIFLSVYTWFSSFDLPYDRPLTCFIIFLLILFSVSTWVSSFDLHWSLLCFSVCSVFGLSWLSMSIGPLLVCSPISFSDHSPLIQRYNAYC
jgi:hypothetical protein